MRRAVVGLLLAWTLVQGLRESWRALRYHLADPWPAAAPVLWTPSSRHVASLRTSLDRLHLDGRLDGVETLAVDTDPALGVRYGDQGWYQYLWLAYLLPEHDLVWTPGEAAALPEPAEAWLTVRGDSVTLRSRDTAGSR